jgi:hypothetical protein
MTTKLNSRYNPKNEVLRLVENDDERNNQRCPKMPYLSETLRIELLMIIIGIRRRSQVEIA